MSSGSSDAKFQPRRCILRRFFAEFRIRTDSRYGMARPRGATTLNGCVTAVQAIASRYSTYINYQFFTRLGTSKGAGTTLSETFRVDTSIFIIAF